MSEANKHVVRRFVDDVINRGRHDVLEEIYTPELATGARAWIAPFRDGFPAAHMQTVELVGEGDKVAARFTCSAAQHGPWQGHPPPGGASNRSPKSPSSPSATAASPRRGGWRTTSTGCSSSV